MVDTSPLLASLLLGQRRRVDPLEAQRAYGQKLIIQGSSTAPLASGNALEGLARALQAGVGGLTAGWADQREVEKGKKTVEALGKISGATNQDELTAAIKGSEIDPDLAGPLMAQILQNKQSQFVRGDAANTFGAGFGNGGTTIDITKPGVSGAPGAGYQTTLATRESAGNPQAVNPQSGAFGTYQFMPQTAAEVRQANPQLNLPEDHRTWTPDQQNQAEQALRGMNNTRLTQLGISVTPATLALAHATGADGAAKLLSTPPNTPMEQAVPQIWIDQNPQMKGKTVGQYVSGFAQFNQGQQGAQPPQGQAQSVLPQGQQVAGPPQAEPQAPSASSQPPEVPRPQPTAEQIQRYKALINSPNGITLEQANQGLNKEITEQWQADKARALAVWQDQQQSKRIQETGAQKLGQEAPLTMIKDRVTNYETKIRPAAQAALDDINAIHQTRQVLDAGAFTGTTAEARTFLAKLGEQLGIPSDQAQNSQVLGSALAKRVIVGMGGSLGTGVSNADVKFMEKAAGGDIAMDEGAIRKILDIGERQSRYILKKHDAEAARTIQLPGMEQLGKQQFQVGTAPTYEEWKKANPPGQTQGQTEAPAPQGQVPTVNTPDEARKLPPGTQFKTPDGRLLVR